MSGVCGVCGVCARARALVGVRFRPNGRDPAYGLDCVGLAGAAFGIAAEAGFAMRGGTIAAVAARIARHGFVRVAVGTPGCLVLMASGAGAVHLGVRVDGGTVHADARIGRVVETPGDAPWPVLGWWRPG